MKFLNWIRTHIVLSFAIVALTIAAIVSAVKFTSHRGAYDDYLVSYNAQQEASKLKIAALPKEVFIDNDYISYGDDSISSTKSERKKNYLYFARDAVVAPLSESTAQEYKKIDSNSNAKLNEYISSLDRSGGAITFRVEAKEAGYGDVAVEMMSNWKNASNEIVGYENISDQIKIQFNKLEIKTQKLGLPASRENFTTLVLKDVVLLKGVNTFTFTTSAYNPYKTDSNKILYVMPDIRNVAVMADVDIEMPNAE